MPQAIHISPIDNVVVALHTIAKGTLVEVDGLEMCIRDRSIAGQLRTDRINAESI